MSFVEIHRDEKCAEIRIKPDKKGDNDAKQTSALAQTVHWCL